MKAAVRDKYGPPDVIHVREIEKPSPADDEVLVRVRAASVNALDRYALKGQPLSRVQNGWRRPKIRGLGTDFAGTVEAVGRNVTAFKPGDAVFGGKTGMAYGEYLTVRADRTIVAKPPNVSFEEAGGVAIAGVTALQAVRDKAQVKPGQNVLVNGASGGVGTFLVQIAKAYGAHVTAVCGPKNVELARSLGADRVIDYTREDFTRTDERYDALLDVAGTHTWSEKIGVLKPNAPLVLIGAPRSSPLRTLGRAMLASRIRGGGHKLLFFVAAVNKANMQAMADLLASGKVRTVVDKTFPLDDVVGAYRYFENAHPRGKVVVTV